MLIRALLISTVFPIAFAQAQDSLVSQQPNASTASMSVAPVLGMSTFSFAGDSMWQSKNGLTAGAIVDFGRSYFSMETGLMYMQQGARASLDATAGGRKVGTVTADVNLEYLALPILGRYNFSGDAQKTFFLKAGAMPQTLLGKEVKVSGFGQSYSTRDLDVATTDVLLVAGAGLEFPFSQNGSIRGDLTYNRGLLKVNNSGDTTLNNQGFLTSVGAVFAF